MDVGVLPGQLPVVSIDQRIAATIAANTTAVLSLPAGIDPTLLVVDVVVLDTFSAPSAPSYNFWIPGDNAVTVAKNSTSIKLINETSVAISCLVVLR